MTILMKHVKACSALTTRIRENILALDDAKLFGVKDIEWMISLNDLHCKDIKTPLRSCACMLQRLRDEGKLEFVSPGVYRRTLTQEEIMSRHQSHKLHRKPLSERNPIAEPRGEVVQTAVVEQPKLKLVDLKEGKDIRFANVRPSRMVVNLSEDGGYQRNPKNRSAKLREIAKKFRPAALGMIHVWVNPDGKPEVLDGAGRRHVCLHLLHEVYDEPIHTCVHDHIKTLEQASKWFLILNPNENTKVSERDKFHALLISKDPDSLRINAAAEVCGIVIGGAGLNGISVQAARSLNHMGVFKIAADLKNGAWRKFKINGAEWVGLGGYVLATGETVSSKQLLDCLSKNGPQSINTDMKETNGGSMPHGRWHSKYFAREILALRNKSKSRNRVSADWVRVDTVMAPKPYCDRWAATVEE